MDDLKHYTVQLDIPISAKKSEAGRGCFGAVFHSKINGAPCVVKKLHDILTGVGGNEYVAHAQWEDIADKFQTEIRLLSQQRHPNIVQFLGVCGLDGDPRDICLVMEQMDIDLDHFIEANKGGIPLELKLRILTDTASGVSHLHANGIVHRDLNSKNVLLSSSLQAKVADLGVSRIIDTRAVGRLTKAPGATEYMPPEALRDQPLYGPKLDCFSFGHLMLYLALEVSYNYYFAIIIINFYSLECRNYLLYIHKLVYIIVVNIENVIIYIQYYLKFYLKCIKEANI